MAEPPSVQQFDEERAEAYDDRIRRLAPGYDALQGAVASVLNARLREEAHLLVVGAGTGEEIVRMGRSHPRWRFTAVDPSAAMLDRCRARVTAASNGLDERVGYVCEPVEETTQAHSFDAATSIFVAHFIQNKVAKRRFFQSIAAQLAPEAPLVWADLYRPTSDAGGQDLRAAWRAQMRTQMEGDAVARVFERVEEGISFVRETGLERLVMEAGFRRMHQFYQHFLWGAWTATRGEEASD